MHGHASARVSRVRSRIFWDKSKYGCSDFNGLGLEDCDDVRGTDRAEPLSGRIVADRGGSWAPMFLHADEDVESCPNRAGCCQLILEV